MASRNEVAAKAKRRKESPRNLVVFIFVETTQGEHIFIWSKHLDYLLQLIKKFHKNINYSVSLVPTFHKTTNYSPLAKSCHVGFELLPLAYLIYPTIVYYSYSIEIRVLWQRVVV
jgi:hypothetical protein